MPTKNPKELAAARKQTLANPLVALLVERITAHGLKVRWQRNHSSCIRFVRGKEVVCSLDLMWWLCQSSSPPSFTLNGATLQLRQRRPLTIDAADPTQDLEAFLAATVAEAVGVPAGVPAPPPEVLA